jgi:hypothetical protein
MKAKENQVGLKVNVTHQLLVYADDVNLLGDKIDIIKKNPETLIDVSNKFFFISGVELLVLQPLLAYCTSPR